MISSAAQRIKNQILDMPILTWILVGFFVSFLLFFIIPVYMDPSLSIQFIANIPVSSVIGSDFRSMVAASSTWLQTGTAPSIVYPALTIVFFTLFTFFSLDTGYKLLLLIILICFILSTLALPAWINRTRDLSAFTMLILVTGFGSYGLQFELERGQWNVIAFTLCLAAIYLFHQRPRARWLAYILFSLSVQLKLFPAIFVFALIEDWSDWKNNLKRIAGLGLVNILALFVLGINPILDTLGFLGAAEASHVGRAFNPSITSFTIFILSPDTLSRKLLHNPLISWLVVNKWAPQLLLLSLFVFCLLIILLCEYRKGSKGFNAYVFLACSIGAFVIPSISFDYKLSILPACVALSIPQILTIKEDSNRFPMILLTFIFSFAYSSTLYSYANKPVIFQNDLPALFVILLICTVLSWRRWNGQGTGLSNSPSNEPMG